MIYIILLCKMCLESSKRTLTFMGHILYFSQGIYCFVEIKKHWWKSQPAIIKVILPINNGK